MKICICDKNLPKISKEQLEDFGFLLIETKELENFHSPMGTHPDIQVCKIKENLLVVEPSVYSYYNNLLSKYGIIIKSGEKIVEDIYPKDCLYNLASNGEIAIHNFEITEENILNEIDFEKVHVNQGYGKCNVLFTKSGVITSDNGIYKALGDRRKLLIETGDIDLDGYDYGFIGGASGYSDAVYFIGNIQNHKDFHKIETFLKEEDTQYEILGDFKLKDFGSLIFLEI